MTIGEVRLHMQRTLQIANILQREQNTEEDA